MKGVSHDKKLKSCSRTGGGWEQFCAPKPGEANRRAAARANPLEPRKTKMRGVRVSGGLKPASVPSATQGRQGTLRGQREQRDGKVKLGTWEIPPARAVSAVRSRRLHESISAERRCGGKSEGSVVAWKPVKAGGAKGPWLKTSRLGSKRELIGR